MTAEQAALDLSPAEIKEIERVTKLVNAAANKITAAQLPEPASEFTDIIDIAGFTRTQSRTNEDIRTITPGARIHALLAYEGFWNAATLLPDNDIHTPRAWKGTPLHYPSWILFALMCIAGIDGIGSIIGAAAWLAYPPNWALFAAISDQYIPDGWTRASELPSRGKRARKHRHNPNPNERTPGTPTMGPPLTHHIEHFLRKWRGQPTFDKDGNQTRNPWAGVRAAVIAQFRTDAMKLAQSLGYLNPNERLSWDNPRREQGVVYDGTVWSFRNALKATASTAPWNIGGPDGPLVTGSKIVTATVRGKDHGSRVVLDILHSGHHHSSEGTHEAASIRLSLDRLRPLATTSTGKTKKEGIRILIVDSVIRGQDVIDIQRSGVIVVNYPHAKSNPGRKDTKKGERAKRFNPTRKEHSQLRATIEHRDANGHLCIHPVMAIGGTLVHMTENSHGDYEPHPLTVINYERRPNADHTAWREYQNVVIPCHSGDLIARIALFQTDPNSTDPIANYGETVRVWSPSSPQAGYLYGRRNDSESWHNTLKHIIKRMNHDAADQLTRVLGVALAENATTKQRDLRQRGLANVLSDSP